MTKTSKQVINQEVDNNTGMVLWTYGLTATGLRGDNR